MSVKPAVSASFLKFLSVVDKLYSLLRVAPENAVFECDVGVLTLSIYLLIVIEYPDFYLLRE